MPNISILGGDGVCLVTLTLSNKSTCLTLAAIIYAPVPELTAVKWLELVNGIKNVGYDEHLRKRRYGL